MMKEKSQVLRKTGLPIQKEVIMKDQKMRSISLEILFTNFFLCFQYPPYPEVTRDGYNFLVWGGCPTSKLFSQWCSIFLNFMDNLRHFDISRVRIMIRKN